MTHVVDRRSQSKNKSAVNRERFLKRYAGKIKDAVSRSISGRSITDFEKGTDVNVPRKDIHEPYLGHGKGGTRETVSPGNSDYEKGDSFRRPTGGGGSGGAASDSDDPLEDDFIFTLTKEEFMQYFFEDLELPNMVKKQLKDTTSFKNQRAGYKTSGASTNMHVLRSLKGALGRRMALGSKSAKRLKEIYKELDELDNLSPTDEEESFALCVKRSALCKEGVALKEKISSIPFLDDIDIRYSNTIKVPKPSTKAVMFCLMDVSGSMDEEKKEIAKRFFILLYLFLSREYKKIEVVFIRHHTSAEEVTEDEFFHSQESGGTIVSSAIELLDETIKSRYADDWNVYVAQASDGDNFLKDSAYCHELIVKDVLPAVQYFAYVEISTGYTQNLWEQYQKIALANDNFSIRQIQEMSDIYPVFCDLFKKQGRENG